MDLKFCKFTHHPETYIPYNLMPLHYYNLLYSTFLSRVPYKIPHPTSVHSPQSLHNPPP